MRACFCFLFVRFDVLFVMIVGFVCLGVRVLSVLLLCGCVCVCLYLRCFFVCVLLYVVFVVCVVCLFFLCVCSRFVLLLSFVVDRCFVCVVG